MYNEVDAKAIFNAAVRYCPCSNDIEVQMKFITNFTIKHNISKEELVLDKFLQNELHNATCKHFFFYFTIFFKRITRFNQLWNFMLIDLSFSSKVKNPIQVILRYIKLLKNLKITKNRYKPSAVIQQPYGPWWLLSWWSLSWFSSPFWYSFTSKRGSSYIRSIWHFILHTGQNS